MSYEAFRHAWESTLAESKLPTVRPSADETLDLRSLDRHYEVTVEPLGGQDAPPFRVTASLSWKWDALLTARALTTEDDMLITVFARDGAPHLETQKPYLRVDIKLTASLPYGKPRPMPSQTAWTRWTRETMGRLERIEPLLPAESARASDPGMLDVLAWREPPKIHATCSATGELLLEAVSISAGQLIELPRLFDDPDREPDDGPDEELRKMFRRVRASLLAWMQALDHLRR
jgi:hypothetical protein